MKNHRHPRHDDPEAADATKGRAGPVLSRRAFVTVTAVGGGAAIAAVGVPILRHLESSSADASTTAATKATTTTTKSTSAAAAAPATSSTTAPSTTTSTASDGAESVAGMGEVQTDNLTITVADGYRTIKTGSYPDWAIDSSFRYPGTPSPQDLTFKVTTSPQIAGTPTVVRTGQVFGVHRNGVVFDPKTAEYYGGHDQMGDWNAVALANQLDSHGAHTRPDGFYHLHMAKSAWTSDPNTHSEFMGWAADGYPIYLRYGYVKRDDPTSGVKNLRSSYRLKSGARPSGSSSPGGTYDGTYVADYEYVDGYGDLDECNGRWTYPSGFGTSGTYAYFLTDQWPYVPHMIKGTPDRTFAPGFGGGSGPMGKSGGGNSSQSQSRTR